MSSNNLNLIVSGQTLTPAQRFAIKTALTKLKLNEGYTDLRFWGKINGIQNDYFILLATVTNTSIQKHFYYSNDNGITFAKIPDVDEFVSLKSPKIRGMFSGDTSHKYKDPDAKKKYDEDGNELSESEQSEEEEESEEEVDEDGNPIEKIVDPNSRKLNELERLAWTVRAIDYDTCIVPKGYAYITPTAEIVKDCTFQGLSVEDTRKVHSYQLYRVPVDPKTLSRNRKLGISNNSDFLDTIVPVDTKQKDTWSLQIDESGRQVTLRSLVWPGYEFHIEAGELNFGGAYFGYGEKNMDILFML